MRERRLLTKERRTKNDAFYTQCCYGDPMETKPGWSYDVRLYHAGTDPAYNGSPKPDYDYRLNCGTGSLPGNVVVDDPSSLFGEDYTSTSFAGKGKVATITVYAVTGVKICKPDDSAWAELEESRVVLDDEELRVKIEVAPQLKSLAQCQQMFGDSLTIKTSGTCPAGAFVPIGNGTTLANTSGKSEIRIAKTRKQLKSLGLLPLADSDGVNEMTVYDVGTFVGNEGSNLSDSDVFATLAYQWRGKATNERSLNLNSTPPNAMLSKTFFQAAGSEIVEVAYGEKTSARRQIMNQADYFYYSGHGLHKFASIDDFEPSDVAGLWTKDLDCVVVSGCSVLDINDYNDNFILDPQDHTASPGKLWAAVGPATMLGYNFTAPLDETGVPVNIVREWITKRRSFGDVDAWMEANADNRAWNACAIVKGERYVYFKKIVKGFWLQRSVEVKDW